MVDRCARWLLPLLLMASGKSKPIKEERKKDTERMMREREGEGKDRSKWKQKVEEGLQKRKKQEEDGGGGGEHGFEFGACGS